MKNNKLGNQIIELDDCIKEEAINSSNSAEFSKLNGRSKNLQQRDSFINDQNIDEQDNDIETLNEEQLISNKIKKYLH